MPPETCAECDRPISDDPDGRAGERPISRWYDDLCVPCGIEELDPR